MSETTDIPVEPIAPQQSHKRRNWIIAGAAAVAAAGIAIGITATSGSGSVQVHGSLKMGLLTYTDDVPGADLTDPGVGDACTAGDGYSDIAVGTTVEIGGSSGTTVAVAALSAGKVDSDGDCEFDFSVAAPDQGSYTVTISHRGTTTWSKAQATSAAGITLSLTYTAG